MAKAAKKNRDAPRCSTRAPVTTSSRRCSTSGVASSCRKSRAGFAAFAPKAPIGRTRAPDPGETAEVDIQEDIEFALIQMKAETLNKINEALARLDEGRYGDCYECGDEIAEARLRALPFAVRCKDCEEEREIGDSARAYNVAARHVELLRHAALDPASDRCSRPRPARGLRPSPARALGQFHAHDISEGSP